MKYIFLTAFFSTLLFSDFCSEITFEDEFDAEELSTIWTYEQGYTFEGSASIFSKTNSTIKDGYLTLIVNNIGTTDSKGDFYPSTSGGISTNLKFGYGKYEFRLSTAGLKGINETIHLIWVADGDYSKDHQFIGFDFQEKGYMSLLAVNAVDKELSVFHGTEVDKKTKEFVKLNSKVRFFTIDYTEEMINWYYDNRLIRQETTATKDLPNKHFSISIRNWLTEKNQHNIELEDYPVKTKIDYFRFTAVDDGGDSCKKITLEKEEEPVKADEVIKTDEVVVTKDKTDDPNIENDVPKIKISNSNEVDSIDGLVTAIQNLTVDENHLLGFSGTITDMSIFKNVKVVWVYSNEEWKGYSPYQKIRDTLEKNKIGTIGEIPPYTGFWIQK